MNIDQSIEHLFRHEYGKIVSTLTNKYSLKYLDLIEDAVQESLLKASNIWAYNSIPKNPTGWLYKVANNYILDQIRHNKYIVSIAENKFQYDNYRDNLIIHEGVDDSLLNMIFACSHPKLTETEQIILSLKILAGFSTKEIASALFKKEESIKKAITRAKKKFKMNIEEIEVPENEQINSRLNTTIKILYLIFNEGYKASFGNLLIKEDICYEALRLANVLKEYKNCIRPELYAIIALFNFNLSRINARVDAKGELVLLKNQNRKLWNKEQINEGSYYLDKASYGVYISKYHIEAAIASVYATSESYDKVNWKLLLELYNLLIKKTPNHIIELNRIVIIEKIKGTEYALMILNKLNEKYNIDENYLFHSIMADFLRKLKRQSEAKEFYNKAITLSNNKIERNFLIKRLQNLEPTCETILRT